LLNIRCGEIFPERTLQKKIVSLLEHGKSGSFSIQLHITNQNSIFLYPSKVHLTRILSQSSKAKIHPEYLRNFKESTCSFIEAHDTYLLYIISKMNYLETDPSTQKKV